MIFQAIIIKLSYRNRERVPRTQINNTKIHNIFHINTPVPLKNNKEVNILINKILPYSAINKIANPPAPYSTLNPETSSDSPSAKSNGVRLVSAKIVTIHKIKRFHINLVNQHNP